MYNCHGGTEQREGRTSKGALDQRAPKRPEMLSGIKEKGRLSVQDYVRCRVRYSCDGAVLRARGRG